MNRIRMTLRFYLHCLRVRFNSFKYNLRFNYIPNCNKIIRNDGMVFICKIVKHHNFITYYSNKQGLKQEKCSVCWGYKSNYNEIYPEFLKAMEKMRQYRG